jgi:hypothetical protein
MGCASSNTVMEEADGSNINGGGARSSSPTAMHKQSNAMNAAAAAQKASAASTTAAAAAAAAAAPATAMKPKEQEEAAPIAHVLIPLQKTQSVEKHPLQSPLVTASATLSSSATGATAAAQDAAKHAAADAGDLVEKATAAPTSFNDWDDELDEAEQNLSNAATLEQKYPTPYDSEGALVESLTDLDATGTKRCYPIYCGLRTFVCFLIISFVCNVHVYTGR